MNIAHTSSLIVESIIGIYNEAAPMQLPLVDAS